MAGDPLYKPLSIYVLSPVELVALGLAMGEKHFAECQKARVNHPDPQKTVCVVNDAIIYTALWPDRTHKDHRPPEDWLHEAGINEASMHNARVQLEIEDPGYEAKMAVRKHINEVMDGE